MIWDGFIDQYMLDEFGEEWLDKAQNPNAQATMAQNILNQTPIGESSREIPEGPRGTGVEFDAPINESTSLMGGKTWGNGTPSFSHGTLTDPPKMPGFAEVAILGSYPMKKYEHDMAMYQSKVNQMKRKQMMDGMDWSDPVKVAKSFISGAPTEEGRKFGMELFKQQVKPGNASGFSFKDYQNATPEVRDAYNKYKGRGFDSKHAPTSAMQNFNFRQGLSPEQRKLFDQQMKLGKTIDVGPYHLNTYTGERFEKGFAPTETLDYKSGVTKAQEQAKADVKKQGDLAKGAEQAKNTLDLLNSAKDISGKMSNRQFGYVAGKMPNITKESQDLDNVLKNLIPNVIDNLGPGPKSDSDIKMLREMLPHQGMEKEAFNNAMERFEKKSIDMINKSHNVDEKPVSTKDAESTKVVNGTTYYKINGKWYAQ